MLDHLQNLQLDVDIVATGLALGYEIDGGWLGHRILTPYPTPQPWAQYKAPIFRADRFKTVDAKHALRDTPNQVEEFWDYQSVTLQRYGLERPYDPTAEPQAAGLSGIDLIARARRQVWLNTERSKEVDSHALLTNTASYAVGHSETIGAGNGWNQKTLGVSNVNPILDLENASNVVFNATGTWPNFISMGLDAWNAFKDNTFVIDRMRGGPGAAADRDNLTPDRAAPWFAIDPEQAFVPDLLVGWGSKYDNTSGTPTEPEFLRIWTDEVIVGIRSPEPVMDVARQYFGVTLAQTIGEMDGKPVMGVAGQYDSNPWKSAVYYTGWWQPWIASNRAAYLILDTVK